MAVYSNTKLVSVPRHKSKNLKLTNEKLRKLPPEKPKVEIPPFSTIWTNIQQAGLMFSVLGTLPSCLTNTGKNLDCWFYGFEQIPNIALPYLAAVREEQFHYKHEVFLSSSASSSSLRISSLQLDFDLRRPGLSWCVFYCKSYRLAGETIVVRGIAGCKLSSNTGLTADCPAQATTLYWQSILIPSDISLIIIHLQPFQEPTWPGQMKV